MPVTSPITIHLLNQGTSLKHYAEKNGLNYSQLILVVNGHRKNKNIVEQLKKDGLWNLVDKGFKKIQQAEAVNGL